LVDGAAQLWDVERGHYFQERVVLGVDEVFYRWTGCECDLQNVDIP